MQSKTLVTLATLDDIADIIKVSRGTVLSWLGHFTLSKYLHKVDRQYYFILSDNSKEALYKYILLKTKKKSNIILRSKLYNIKSSRLSII